MDGAKLDKQERACRVIEFEGGYTWIESYRTPPVKRVHAVRAGWEIGRVGDDMS